MENTRSIFNENAPQGNHKNGGGFGLMITIILVVIGLLLVLKYFIG